MDAATQQWQQLFGSGQDEAAKGLVIRFELRPIEDEGKTDAEGRPVFVEKEFIEIRSPNDPLSVVEREVGARDRQLYAQAYKAFKEGMSDVLTGTPLKEWPPAARSQVDFLAFRGVRTVEQLVEVSDDGCQHLGHGYLTLRNKASAWLAKAKDASESTRMAAELQRRDVEIQNLKRQVSELVSRFGEKEESTPKKKGKEAT